MSTLLKTYLSLKEEVECKYHEEQCNAIDTIYTHSYNKLGEEKTVLLRAADDAFAAVYDNPSRTCITESDRELQEKYIIKQKEISDEIKKQIDENTKECLEEKISVLTQCKYKTLFEPGSVHNTLFDSKYKPLLASRRFIRRTKPVNGEYVPKNYKIRHATTKVRSSRKAYEHVNSSLENCYKDTKHIYKKLLFHLRLSSRHHNVKKKVRPNHLIVRKAYGHYPKKTIISCPDKYFYSKKTKWCVRL